MVADDVQNTDLQFLSLILLLFIDTFFLITIASYCFQEVILSVYVLVGFLSHLINVCFGNPIKIINLPQCHIDELLLYF